MSYDSKKNTDATIGLVLSDTIKNSEKSRKIFLRSYSAKTITDADNADDIALLANAPAQAEALLHSLEEPLQASASMSMYTRRNVCVCVCVCVCINNNYS